MGTENEGKAVPLTSMLFWTRTMEGAGAGGGFTPVPVRLMVWGLFEAVSCTDRVPVRVPVAVGVKVTLMMQDWPTASVEGLTGQGAVAVA